MHKQTIAVLFGGYSSEYSASLASAHSVLQHMDKTKYTPVPVGITPAGDWYYFHGETDKIAADCWFSPADCTPVAFSPNRSSHALLLLRPEGMDAIHIDVAFPVLHGKNGEDGTVQGLFEMAGIPLVGCGTLSSALCMDKDRAHRLVNAAGVCVPDSFVLCRGDNTEQAHVAAERLGYPLFVKPVRAGSSFGITRVLNESGLSEAIRLALRYDDHAIMEQCIFGFEVGCAVMGNEELLVGELDEVELSGGFFDYSEKYTLKTSALHVPARITPEQTAQIKQAAKLIYRALGCRGFARVDVFLASNGMIVFNEVNTIPGFTTHSRFPNMMKAAGVPFEQVISRAIELAVGK